MAKDPILKEKIAKAKKDVRRFDRWMSKKVHNVHYANIEAMSFAYQEVFKSNML